MLQELQIQTLDDCLQFIIGDAQIAFGVGQTGVVELLHDKGQVNPIHPGVVAPGPTQALGAEVTA